jgi:hypothetical protein
MKDKFADLEEPKNRTLPTALSILAILAAMFAWHMSSIEPVELSGIVESTDDSRRSSSIRLDNGMVVSASLSTNLAVTKDDRVVVVEHTKIFGAPAYRVAGKGSPD